MKIYRCQPFCRRQEAVLFYLLQCHSHDLYHLKCFDSTLPRGSLSAREEMRNARA